MIPPTSGMQAIAAAMFGGKSIDEGSPLGFAAGGGTGGGVGSAGSGIQLLTELGGGFVKRTSFPCRAVSFSHLPPSRRYGAASNPLPLSHWERRTRSASEGKGMGEGEAEGLAPGEGGGRTEVNALGKGG